MGLLVLGAVTSIAVAWGIALWNPRIGSGSRGAPEQGWYGQVPSDWPVKVTAQTRVGLGYADRIVVEMSFGNNGNKTYAQHVRQFGWPMLSCEYEMRTWPTVQGPAAAEWRGSIAFRGGSVVLPCRPRTTGLGVNTVVWAAACGGLMLSWDWFRKRKLRRAGTCPMCGYDWMGLAECPECGSSRPDADTQRNGGVRCRSEAP